MPELPEVETVCRGLAKRLIGHKIEAVEVLRSASVAAPATGEFVKSLSGRRFEEISRRGKYIVCRLDKQAALVAHLRMSGRLLVTKCGAVKSSHVRVRMQLDSKQELVFEDMRVFGRLWFVDHMKNLEAVVPALAELGPEPLEELSASYLEKALCGKKMPIKAALLDQTVIAGIGNIYADESLFQAGIHPLTPAGQVSRAKLESLCQCIVAVLAAAIAAGGSTLRNYTGADGVNGNYQGQALVYGRTGQPCRSCDTAIERLKIGGRSSHFCRRCQKGGRRAR